MARTLYLGLACLAVLAGAGSGAARVQGGGEPPVVTPDETPPPDGAAAPSRPVAVSPSSPTATRAPRSVKPSRAPTAVPAKTPATAAATDAQVAEAPPGPPEIAAPPGPPVIERAELCLRAEAATAARAETSAKLAVDLLLEDLCGADVEAASRYERNLMALSRFNPASERGRAGLSTARVDEETGEIVDPRGVDVASAVREAFPEVQGSSPSPSLRRYAAQLVIAERARLAAAARRTR